MRRIPAITVFVAVLMVAHMLLAQTRMTPTAPGTHGDPQWQGVRDYFGASHTDECGLADLRRDPSGKTYTSPSGLALNATYVDFLRRIVPPHTLRFRMSERRRPILVVANGSTIGVLMPVAQ